MTENKKLSPRLQPEAQQNALSPELEAIVAPSDDFESWSVDLRGKIAALAETGAVFSADDINRKVMPPPGHPNWYGQVWAGLHREGVIEVAGLAVSGRASNAGASIRLWRGTAAARRGRGGVR